MVEILTHVDGTFFTQNKPPEVWQTFRGTLCILIQLRYKLHKQDAVYENNNNNKKNFAIPVCVA
jgi:hypothetical protein